MFDTDMVTAFMLAVLALFIYAMFVIYTSPMIGGWSSILPIIVAGLVWMFVGEES